MSYLHNSWYMAAWLDELPAHGMLTRTILEQPLCIFRDSSGSPHAVFDRCPHRFAPLSKGRIDGDAIVCGYHGLAFDGAGACIGNPHGPLLRGLAVRSYPVVERDRVLWVWMGDPVSADPAPIRDLSFLVDAPDTAFNKGYVNGKGHYQLFVDNILDLSHTDYLHPSTLGGGSITRTRAKVEERPDGVIAIHWHSFDEVPIPLVAARLPPEVTRVDAWSEVEWSAPGVMKLVNGAVPAGAPRESGGNVINVHVLTPETASTCHYFFASTRDYQRDDPDLNEAIRVTRAAIFSQEDEPMIAAQQERMGDADFWALKPVLIKIDEGAGRVRRRMDALIAAEQAASSPDRQKAPSR